MFVKESDGMGSRMPEPHAIGVSRFELRPRDLNPDYLVQSEACCHYTRAQSDSNDSVTEELLEPAFDVGEASPLRADLGQVGVRVGDLLAIG